MNCTDFFMLMHNIYYCDNENKLQHPCLSISQVGVLPVKNSCNNWHCKVLHKYCNGSITNPAAFLRYCCRILIFGHNVILIHLVSL